MGLLNSRQKGCWLELSGDLSCYLLNQLVKQSRRKGAGKAGSEACEDGPERRTSEWLFHCHYFSMVNWEPRYASSEELKPQETLKLGLNVVSTK